MGLDGDLSGGRGVSHTARDRGGWRGAVGVDGILGCGGRKEKDQEERAE